MPRDKWYDKPKTNKPRCSESVRKNPGHLGKFIGSNSYRPCKNPASIEFKGKGYCKRHDPKKTWAK